MRRKILLLAGVMVLLASAFPLGAQGGAVALQLAR